MGTCIVDYILETINQFINQKISNYSFGVRLTHKKQNDIIFGIKGGMIMCKVKMDLNNDENLNFAIYSLVLSKQEGFLRRSLYMM